jgi:hypothetical protein
MRGGFWSGLSCLSPTPIPQVKEGRRRVEDNHKGNSPQEGREQMSNVKYSVALIRMY